MRKILFAVVGSALLAASAAAGLVCATPPEMKILQSAALQQQLMVAAQNCHMDADYTAFLTAYRGRLQQSDTALQAFFASRPRGEDYNAYKSRIAKTVSLRVTRDAQFCATAQKVFDMALGRGAERNGLAPEPPQLIDTGYEGCRPVEDRQLEARALPVPTPRPEVAKPRVAAIPAPRLSPEAAHALAMRPAPVQVAAAAPPVAKRAPKPVQAAAQPKPVQVATAKPKPAQVAAAKPQPAPVAAARPQPAQVAAATPKPAAAEPAPKPVQVAGPAAPAQPVPPPAAAPKPPAAVARLAAARRPPAHQGPSIDEDPSLFDATGHLLRHPPQVVLTETRPAERPQWRQDDPYPDDHMPNAYRPGAEWVLDPPPRWHPPHRARMVLGPDGRWIVLIGTGPRWGRD